MLGEWKLPRAQETFLSKTRLLKMDPSARKLQKQEINRIKSKKINRTVKLCTLATNNLILSGPATDP